MIGIELVDRPPATPGQRHRRRDPCVQYCLERGVLIGVGGNYGNVLRIQPPLTISEAELERTLEVIGQGLRQQG